MKKITFPLKRPVRITPLKGDTEVNVVTSGDVIVSECKADSCKREPPIKVVSTDRGCITCSPKGYMMTLKVILPTEMASEREYLKQVNMLFDKMLAEEL